ncbi:MAG: PEGA domain-containing protein [Myxococcales bacterium]|nr:PEGA domain-containing protein [Polyangiaceae bacterium]MDW8250646.1 PEGA domain-containing protein [Myxococcales bacterium]
MSGRATLLLCWLLVLGGSLPAGARPNDGPSPAVLEAAKDFFRKGNAEMDAGNHERALEYFLQSRAQVPSIANTNNAGLALEKLGRLDEALEMYESLLREFAARLTSEERTAVNDKVVALRREIGTLEVSANVDGVLVIDGKRRGDLPLSEPLRVMPGPHVVRVIKDGYASAEATISVGAGQSARVDLKLEALTAVGRLRVTDSSGVSGVEVLVDGAPVGYAPWEGALGPGRHLVALQGKEVGTAPVAVTVLVGQVVKAELKAVRLGPVLSVVFEPMTAKVTLNGVEVGSGPWRGRLPAGEHTFEGHEEGYFPATVQVGVTQTTVNVALRLDEKHPRWRQARSGIWRLGAMLAGAYGGNLGSKAEADCAEGCGKAAAGGIVAGRLSFHLPNRLFFDAMVGALQVERSLSRTVARGQATYSLQDQLRFQGLMAQLGAGYQVPLSKDWFLGGRVGVGFLSLKVRDEIEGALRVPSGDAEILVDRNGSDRRSATLVVAPSLGLEGRVAKRLHLGLGLGALLSLLDGPDFDHGEVLPRGECKKMGDPGCLRGDNFTANERSYSRFLLWTPQVSLGADFLPWKENEDDKAQATLRAPSNSGAGSVACCGSR